MVRWRARRTGVHLRPCSIGQDHFRDLLLQSKAALDFTTWHRSENCSQERIHPPRAVFRLDWDFSMLTCGVVLRAATLDLRLPSGFDSDGGVCCGIGRLLRQALISVVSRRVRPLSVMVQHRASTTMSTASTIATRTCQLSPAIATGTAATTVGARRITAATRLIA
jgi:hypothetical protein